jgi:hypothetical protein
MKEAMSTILVVGIIRNGEKTLENTINKCNKALVNFKKVSYYIVESDSSDSTSKILLNLKNRNRNFDYIEMGEVRERIPNFYERLCYCRNEYVRYIRNLSTSERPNFVLVVDLDGINSSLTKKSLDSCFRRDDWDAVTSNQTFGYYDILALRCKNWQENDWRDDHQFYRDNLVNVSFSRIYYPKKIKRFLDLDKTKHLAIYSKMLKIPKSSDWIEVSSGFGGASIYKVQIFEKFDYTNDRNLKGNEHVILSSKIINNGGKIFINPAFINSHINTYNINKIFFVRTIRELIWRNKFIYKSKFYRFIKKI